MTEEEEKVLKTALVVALRSEQTMLDTLSAAQDVATKLAGENRILKRRLNRYEGKTT